MTTADTICKSRCRGRTLFGRGCFACHRVSVDSASVSRDAFGREQRHDGWAGGQGDATPQTTLLHLRLEQ